MTEYDFVIVGAGASGCALASTLAKGLPNHQILLLEGGGKNEDKTYTTLAERHWALVAPGYNWGYKTIPQKNLDGREIDQSRGKGLGGSTAINFCVYTRGPEADYDRWADLVGDTDWAWKSSLSRYRRLERCRQPPTKYQEMIHMATKDHGEDGPVDVAVPDTFEPGFTQYMDAIYKHHPKNLDVNAGNPVGAAIQQNAMVDGQRVSARTAFLKDVPSNLSIKTETTIHKVLFDGKKAVGVEYAGGKIMATKEVILSGGPIDTPKLLLLSGVGPPEALNAHSIPIKHPLPAVGHNLNDRLFLELVSVTRPGSYNRTSRVVDPDTLASARTQYEKDKTGDLAGYYLPQMIGYFKSPAMLETPEFGTLDPEIQALLKHDTKPHYEIISHNPSPSVKAPDEYIAIAVAVEGTHGGQGSVTLKSADPADPPLIDPTFLSHPFDQRLALQAMKEALSLISDPDLMKDTLRLGAGPEGGFDATDEQIMAYVRQTAISMWHTCGTVRMGKSADHAGVDKDCKVFGLEGLRVVDLSVVPFLPSAHTQACGYLIGVTAAEKMVKEYGGKG